MYLDVGGALPEMESAIALAPGNAAVQSYYGSCQGLLGQQEVALAAIRRAIALGSTELPPSRPIHVELIFCAALRAGFSGR